ncbi:IclR family transcriptional regulator [Fodinicurvata sp. EGI_FJ10296]|uniref:IclR family transcriptional regulator n=1 Tax=Fodinicurvata sp. EGI_FJ10296 TaxID=3231908 RepID=UPI003452BF05
MTKEQATYAAPALEKGLDILELLAAEGRALTTRDIAERLGRSKNEIFRMVRVLINRGYIARDRDGEGLTLTNKLFALGMQTAKTRDLVAVAGPVVENLAEETRQSVHLVVANRGETVVIAAASGGSDMMFTLRLGYRRPLIDAHSGLLLIAFQPAETRRRMIQESIILMRSDVDMAALEADLDAVRQEGSLVRDSRDIVGITDIASPVVLNDGRAVASLIVAYLNRRETTANYEAVREKVIDACADIAAGLEDYRPPAMQARQ